MKYTTDTHTHTPTHTHTHLGLERGDGALQLCNGDVRLFPLIAQLRDVLHLEIEQLVFAVSGVCVRVCVCVCVCV